MQLQALALYATTLGIACAVPGPTTAAVVSRVLARGASSASGLCFGLMVGDLLWLVLTVYGLSYVAAEVHPALVVIRFVGAGYLLYLAWTFWTAPSDPLPSPAAPARGMATSVLSGVAVALGNPKTMLFYLAVLPTIFDLGALDTPEVIEIGTVLTLVYGTVLAGYVLLASRARLFFRSARAMRILNRGTGATMACAAIAVATR